MMALQLCVYYLILSYKKFQSVISIGSVERGEEVVYCTLADKLPLLLLVVVLCLGIVQFFPF